MKIDNIFTYVLASSIVVGFFALLYLLIVKSVPETNSEVLNMTIGALIGCFTAIVGYYFGSSKGSKEKTDIIAKEKK